MNLMLSMVRVQLQVLGFISPKMAARKAFRLFCRPQSRIGPVSTPLFEKAEKLEFSFNGETVRGVRWNHPSPKKLLLLHGFSSGIANFEHFVPPLLMKGYEVLGFDAPAHGRSTGTTINVLTYKNLVEELFRRYGPVTSFIAHSFGGLCLSLALEETPHDESFRAVLIAPAAETTTAMRHFFELLKIGPRVQKAFGEVIRETGGHEAGWFSVARAMKNIKAQVLFLQDEEDRITPASDLAGMMKRNAANTRFVFTKGLGHRRIYRDPQPVATIVDFF